MFEALRRMILPIIIIVLVTFAGMIVLQWGLDISRRGPGVAANIAGVVNGEEISWQAFHQTYSNLLQNERASRGADYEIPDDRARQLEQQAWDQLVADRLIKQESARLNIKVSDLDVYEYLKYSPPQFMQQAPELQTDGRFDYQKYLALMQDPSAASLWASIEPMIKEDLKRLKVQMMIMEAAHITEEEVRQAFMDRKEKVTVGIINAPMTQFYSQVPEATDEELRAYFDEHQDDYPVDERVVLDIVKIIKQPSDFDEEFARARAREVYDSVTSGSDFEEFARIFSDDPGSAAGGGDLGWFAPGRMVKEFDSAAFVMEEGDISPPIKTSFGWHVLKHHGYREEEKAVSGQTKKEKVREAHVSHILIRAVASAETLEDAWQQLDMIRTEAEEQGFVVVAQEEGLEVHTTDPIEEDGYISYVGAGGSVLQWAFENEVGTVSEVMDLPNVYCVMRISDRLPAGTADFEAIMTELRRDYRNEKLANICRDTMQLVYDEIHRGVSVENAAKKFQLTYEKLSPFSRDGSVAKLASDPVVIGTAFGLGEIGAISGPIDHSTGTVILELLSRESPDLTEFNEKRDSVYDAVLSTKRQRAYQAWYTYVIEKADVQSNVDFQRRR